MTPAQRQRVAEIIHEKAERVRKRHTIAGYWPSHPRATAARTAHRELIELAAAVREGA